MAVEGRVFNPLTGVPSLNQSTDGAGSAVTSHITLKSLPLVAYWFSFAFVHVMATGIKNELSVLGIR